MINFIGSNVICVICPSPQSGDAAEYRRWADACARQAAGPRASGDEREYLITERSSLIAPAATEDRRNGDVSPAHTGCR